MWLLCRTKTLPLSSLPTPFALPPPERIDGEALRRRILAEHGVRLAGGQDRLKGKLLRMAHMGASANEEHLMAGLEAIERALASEGERVEPGAARTAALEALSAEH